MDFSDVELLAFDHEKGHGADSTENGVVAIQETRRKHARHPARWVAKATFADKTHFHCRLENVSISGALLNASIRVRSGQRAHLKMDSYVFGVRRALDAIVEFKHVSLCDDTYRIGCEFIKISESNKKFIELYVQKKNPHIEQELENSKV